MSGDRPEPRLEPMPIERAILWNPSLPGARTSGRAPYPIFFQQEAVIAMQEHLKSSPQQAIFGFLIGDVYRDPETGVLYTLIDKTLRLNQAIYGDKTEIVVSRLWDRMQEQLAKAAGVLLGWYHSHPGQGGFLTAHDVETHEKFFTDPWQVAVLVAAEAGGVTGRFFRASQNADWHKTPLPFYELLPPESIKADGKKRSFITWRNYKAFASKTDVKKDVKKRVEKKGVEKEAGVKEDVEEDVKEDVKEEVQEQDQLRIMRGSADDIPVIRTSADDEPAPPPPPPPPPASKKRPSAPVFIPDEPEPEPAPPPPPPPPPRAAPPRRPTQPTGPAADLPWQVPPEDLPPPPPLPPAAPPPPPQAPVREPRRTPTHQFRLLDQEAEAPRPRRRKRKRRWLGKAALLLLLAGAGAGAYWYFALRDPTQPPPWAGLVDRAKRLVARNTSPPPPPPPPPPRPPSRPTPRAPAASRPPTSRPAGEESRPAPPPVARPPVDPFARFDRLSDSLARAVRGFQERAALFASGQLDCGALARGLVTVETLWITYNNERRARISAFDPQRAAQDQALYARVDSVESRFEGTGCSRP